MRRSALRIARPLARSLAGSSPVAAGPLSSLDLDHLQDTYSSRDYDMFANKNFTDLVAFTRASAKWVPDATGTLVQVASGAPATAYDSLTLEKLGLSIEEQRTNLQVYSQDFTNAAWSKSGVTLTANAAVAPDGTTTMTKVVANSGVSTVANDSMGGVARTPVVAASSPWCWTIYAKAAELSYIRIREAISSGLRVKVNLLDGTLVYENGSSSNMAVSTAYAGNGIWRIAATRTTGSAETTQRLDIKPGIDTGDGVSGVYIWGAQLEQASFPSSYIPTTGPQVTRAADSVIISNIAPWFNPTEGTLYVEAAANRSAAVLHNGSSPRLAVLYSSVNSGEHIALYRRAGDNIAGASVSTGGSGYPVTRNVVGDGALTRFALGYKAGDSALSVDGGGVGTVTSALPSGIDRLSIGSLGGSAGAWSGQIRAVRYFPKRLSNAELQALTAKADPGFTLDFNFDAKTYYMGLA